jgi:hypothetical protein
VPFAGPVSFFGFMLLGPTVLIVLRVYLQICVEPVGPARTLNVDRAGANVGPASESADPALQWPDFLSAAPANNAVLCLEGGCIPRLGFGSAWRKGSSIDSCGPPALLRAFEHESASPHSCRHDLALLMHVRPQARQYRHWGWRMVMALRQQAVSHRGSLMIWGTT